MGHDAKSCTNAENKASVFINVSKNCDLKVCRLIDHGGGGRYFACLIRLQRCCL